MEANVPAPSVRIEKPLWKKALFWAAVAGGLGFLMLVAIGMLATLVVPNVLVKYQFAVRQKAMVDIVSIENALREYSIANGGKYPDSLTVLVTPDVNGKMFLNTRTLPKDPWGRAYEYDPPGPGSPHPRVLSLGRDGRPGGEGEDADLDRLSRPEPR